MVYAVKPDPQTPAARRSISTPGPSARMRQTAVPRTARRRNSPAERSTARPSERSIARLHSTVTSLPTQPRLPLWLKVLGGLQQGATVGTGCLVAAALATYSWTVYIDSAVTRTSRQLDRLESQAQQMTSANEALKQSIAEQAESPAAKLQDFKTSDTIFLTPEPSREPVEPSPVSPLATVEMPHPLGY
ncbi:hypothetical protein IQ241_03930 [Romeria aff. gracilis LEGE 07310]|uniref:Cell division protein FtsL n=1 Tax=Vasconcelosia minhoensis LEGE 07310 TaxID=915328 RepID=A0A8J7A9F4_9CYAN|nr:hypothetical protein [Romeria gracilis]MBE9076451.1 hypothetical protein [Romeria aff. gracilis LEGE 07310]